CHVADSLRFLKKCGYGLFNELRCGDALSFQFFTDFLVQVIRDGYGQFAHGCAPFCVCKASIPQRQKQSHSQEPTTIH
ncbi:hypothetical protein, partial [Gemmiger formicilis]|uniref:hypothetical protein n=1 Tax=Gemmiger formicilis TaxID=745368 RepID=UPI003CCB6693